MIVIAALMGAGIFMILVAGANLNSYPAPSHEPNDYGEKHRSL